MDLESVKQKQLEKAKDIVFKYVNESLPNIKKEAAYIQIHISLFKNLNLLNLPENILSNCLRQSLYKRLRLILIFFLRVHISR